MMKTGGWFANILKRILKGYYVRRQKCDDMSIHLKKYGHWIDRQTELLKQYRALQ